METMTKNVLEEISVLALASWIVQFRMHVKRGCQHACECHKIERGRLLRSLLDFFFFAHCTQGKPCSRNISNNGKDESGSKRTSELPFTFKFQRQIHFQLPPVTGTAESNFQARMILCMLPRMGCCAAS